MGTPEKRLLRVRALSAIQKEDWLSYNPLFTTYIPVFDECFNRGIPLDINYYVTRKGRAPGTIYEEELCKTLFPTDNTAKFSYLIAKVGNGKTSMCKHITEKLNTQQTQTSICIYVDMGLSGKKETNIEPSFRDATFRALKQKGIVETNGAFCKGVFDYAGFSGMTPNELRFAYETLSYKYIIDYIDSLHDFQKVLVIIDNVDECGNDMINGCKKFAKQLRDHCASLSKSYGILLPLRKHTLKKYFDQEHFADNQLPQMDEIELIKNLFTQNIDKIKVAMNKYSQEMEYPEIHGPYSYPSIIVTITPESAEMFFHRLIETVGTSEFWFFVRALSNSNYKFLISNIYNFIHSCKLPLIPLFNQVWLSDFYNKHNIQTQENIPFNRGLETLLAIHYPFFDEQASHIINVFNLSNMDNAGCYENTLIITRLLCFLKNHMDQQMRLSDIREIFDNYGYLNVINKAIDKCFEYGLVEASNGTHIDDLTDDSELNISSIGRFYIDILICNNTYLCFMADDTPMPKNVCEDICKKYHKHGPKDENFPNIIKRASDNFISFIKTEEALEKSFLDGYQIDYNDFLLEMSICKDSKPQNISEHIESNRSQHINAEVLKKYL